MRFSTKQLLIATAVIAACLVAGLVFKAHQRRAFFLQLFGASEAYDAVRKCSEFSLYRVTSPANVNGVDWVPPTSDSLAFARALPAESADLLRTALTSPTNFDRSIVKDFVFRPSLMLATDGGEDSLRIFLDFQSQEAALLRSDNRVWFVAIDGVSATLQKLLAPLVSGDEGRSR